MVLKRQIGYLGNPSGKNDKRGGTLRVEIELDKKTPNLVATTMASGQRRRRTRFCDARARTAPHEWGVACATSRASAVRAGNDGQAHVRRRHGGGPEEAELWQLENGSSSPRSPALRMAWWPPSPSGMGASEDVEMGGMEEAPSKCDIKVAPDPPQSDES